MAWSSATISAISADILLLAALHAATEIGRSGATSRWVAGSLGTSSDADNTDTNKPVSRAGDRFGHLRTRPATSETAHTLVLDLGSAAPDFDGILIWGHNFTDISGMTVKVEIADNGAFSTNLQEIASASPGGSDDRVVLLTLTHSGTDPRRYSGVEWMRLIFEGDGSTTFRPEVAEVWPFRRRTFETNFLRGFDPDRAIADTTVHTSRSGVESRSTRFKGKAIIDGQLLLDGSSEITTARDYWRDSEEGTLSSIVIPEPSSAPEKAYVVLPDGGLTKPSVAKDVARWHYRGSEQRPFVSAELEASS